MRDIDIDIPEPCAARWDEMQPEARGRFCAACKTHVHDLSAMTQAEAQRLLARSEGREDLCLSYEHGEDGVPMFTPPRAPLVPAGRLLRMAPAAGLAATLAACTPSTPHAPAATQAQALSTDRAEPVLMEIVAEPERQRSLLANPLDAVPPPPPRVDPDRPCDGGASKQPPAPTASTAAPAHRTMGKPMMRKKGRMRRPL